MIHDHTLTRLKSLDRATMEGAFNEIYKEYSLLVYYVAFSYTHEEASSQDITNQTFANFYESRYKLTKGKKIKYYLVKTSRNLALNFLRHESFVPYEEAIGVQKEETKSFGEYLERFSSFLSGEELDLLVYRFLYGFKFREIAKGKGVSVNAVSSKYKRALDKIRAHYEKGDL